MQWAGQGRLSNLMTGIFLAFIILVLSLRWCDSKEANNENEDWKQQARLIKTLINSKLNKFLITVNAHLNIKCSIFILIYSQALLTRSRGDRFNKSEPPEVRIKFALRVILTPQQGYECKKTTNVISSRPMYREYHVLELSVLVISWLNCTRNVSTFYKTSKHKTFVLSLHMHGLFPRDFITNIYLWRHLGKPGLWRSKLCLPGSAFP